jgi:hypothetical protein
MLIIKEVLREGVFRSNSIKKTKEHAERIGTSEKVSRFIYNHVNIEPAVKNINVDKLIRFEKFNRLFFHKK